MDFFNIDIDYEDIILYIPKETLNSVFEKDTLQKLIVRFIADAKVKVQAMLDIELLDHKTSAYLIKMYCIVDLLDFAGVNCDRFKDNIKSILKSKSKQLNISVLESKYPDSIVDYDKDAF